MVCRGTNVLGSKWQSVTGRLKHITVGQAWVWGISPKNEVNNARLDRIGVLDPYPRSHVFSGHVQRWNI